MEATVLYHIISHKVKGLIRTETLPAMVLNRSPNKKAIPGTDAVPGCVVKARARVAHDLM